MMRRGQAALEYLVTYGWGFLILLFVVGALAYFGFLNPSKYIPARCSFGSQLECTDYSLQANPAAGQNGNALFIFRNSFGDNINIVSMTTANNTGSITSPATPVYIAKGNTSAVITFKPGNTDETFLTKGDRVDLQLIVTFQRAPNGPLHNVTGEVFATVQ